MGGALSGTGSSPAPDNGMGLNGGGSGKVVDVGGDMVIVTVVLPEGLEANGQSGSIEAVSVNGVEIRITSEDEGSFSGALARAVHPTMRMQTRSSLADLRPRASCWTWTRS